MLFRSNGSACDVTTSRPDALLVALLHEGELSEHPLPVEPHDRRVGAVALPSGAVRISAPTG